MVVCHIPWATTPLIQFFQWFCWAPLPHSALQLLESKWGVVDWLSVLPALHWGTDHHVVALSRVMCCDEHFIKQPFDCLALQSIFKCDLPWTLLHFHPTQVLQWDQKMWTVTPLAWRQTPECLGLCKSQKQVLAEITSHASVSAKEILPHALLCITWSILPHFWSTACNCKGNP